MSIRQRPTFLIRSFCSIHSGTYAWINLVALSDGGGVRGYIRGNEMRVRLIALIFLLEHILGILESHFNCAIGSSNVNSTLSHRLSPISLIIELSITSLNVLEIVRKNGNVSLYLCAICVNYRWVMKINITEHSNPLCQVYLSYFIYFERLAIYWMIFLSLSENFNSQFYFYRSMISRERVHAIACHLV